MRTDNQYHHYDYDQKRAGPDEAIAGWAALYEVGVYTTSGCCISAVSHV